MHGVKESENEDTDVVVTEILNELLQEKLTDVDIDRSHRLVELKKGKNQGLSSSSSPGITLETEYLKNNKCKKQVFIEICLDTGWRNFS